ncbi:methylitaconate delta2-delta3-isomerase [Coprinopsis cinerea okayama7|uniref:Methylitaconate delta2-delta3-isomerase n=1 Tax=Coprinopsis cinerea (strain Okayama-7 / 130 / ATCC MYA-4618 / FGSC 9003) TaxID=240176 RepID=A8N4W7_COPC7|nr:methylitaconate delta2-delta3-isomerase [Coprinopsis cinerea okayama7\|eukprot:XP_001829938.1 methylitaconate delta2-delta3-isomerase [Coprinopsis cinerea okayama7\
MLQRRLLLPLRPSLVRLYTSPKPSSTRLPQSLSETPNPLPASFLRGGTSKGIFINRAHLPADQSLWKPIFLGLMGSPDPIHGRQLNGMGGGVSSLSKICVVGRPRELSADVEAGLDRKVDVEYTFVQVGIKDDSIDISGNCGNLSSMIGAFALDEGIVSASNLLTPPSPPSSTTTTTDGRRVQRTTVLSLNTNTNKIISTSFPTSSPSESTDRDLLKPVLDIPEASVAGVPGTASRILLQFHNPGGARTGKLLPTNEATTLLRIPHPQNPNRSMEVAASLVDATNPSVFVSYDQLAWPSEEGLSLDFGHGPRPGLELPLDQYFAGEPEAVAVVSPMLENIRQAGARAMGLDPSAQAQPKIAILSSPSLSRSASRGDENDSVDIVAHALSMGVLHKAIPMTLGLCLGVAAKIPNTIPWKIVQQARADRADFNRFIAGATPGSDDDLTRILHPSGTVDVGAEFDAEGNVKIAQVVRTGRRLMRGEVYW